MEQLPQDVTDTIYKYSHQMLYSECMKQLQLYRLHSACNESYDFFEYAQYSSNGVRKPCIDVNNINTPSRNISNSIHYDNKFLCNKY